MRILILINDDGILYKFRKELLQALLEDKHEVWVSVPAGDYTQIVSDIGCRVIGTPLKRRSIDPINDLRLLLQYRRLLKQIKPGIVLTYTIKPNIYGGFICRMRNVPYITSITGLGSALGNKGLLQTFVTILYRIALKKAQRVYFQNQSNLDFFVRKGILKQKHSLLPGSGVNLTDFTPLPYPPDDTVEFVFIGRLMKEKGIDEYLMAAEAVCARHENVRFHICGFCEQDYDLRLNDCRYKENICNHGMVRDIREIFAVTHCTVQPSYHEGMSNVLLESAATARPVIATDIPGCREAVDDGVSGYLFPKGDTEALIETIEKFLLLTWEQKREMGIAGRRKAEREFDRKIVVDAYRREIDGAV